MTAISVPLTSEKEMTDRQTTKGCTLRAVAVLISMLTLLVVAGFVLYVTISSIAPSCDLPDTHQRSQANDFNFKAHGRLDDNDFDEDFHYDHENNVLVTNITSQGPKYNATVLHDFRKGFSTYVIPSRKKCFLGALESDSYDILSHANDGNFIELPSPRGRHYLSQGIISPPYLERTANPLVTSYCSGLETSWIEPSIEGATMQKRQAGSRSGPTVVIITADGTIIISEGVS